MNSILDTMEDLKKLVIEKNILIYGAQEIADQVIEGLYAIDHHVSIIGCAVSDMRGNVAEISGIKVKQIHEYHVDKDTTFVIISVGNRAYHEDIKKTLYSIDYKKVFTLTQYLESILDNIFLKNTIKRKLSKLMEAERDNSV